MSKTIKRVIVYLAIVLQLASLVAIGYFAVRAWAWKTQAVMFAGYHGFEEAVTDYRRGHRRILEVKVFDSGGRDYSGKAYSPYDKESAKRQEGPFEVWWVMISDDSFYSEPAAAYIKSYNSAMRHRVENPELYTPAGDRKPGSLKPATKPTPRGAI